jgi:hypothetical protein
LTAFTRPPKPEKCSPATLENPSAICVTPAAPDPKPGARVVACTEITPDPAGATVTSSWRPRGSFVATRAMTDEPSTVARTARVACHHADPSGVTVDPPHVGTGFAPNPSEPSGAASVSVSSLNTLRPPCANRSCHGSSRTTAVSGPDVTESVRACAAPGAPSQNAAHTDTASSARTPEAFNLTQRAATIETVAR